MEKRVGDGAMLNNEEQNVSGRRFHLNRAEIGAEDLTIDGQVEGGSTCPSTRRRA
jgi:hypothetical protein